MRTEYGLAALLGLALASTGCQTDVSYQQHIAPILKEKCQSCHGPDGKGYLESGFSVDSYEAVMKGTKFGPVIIAGNSAASTLYRMVTHQVDPKIHMPQVSESDQMAALSQEQIDAFKQWIDKGAKNN